MKTKWRVWAVIFALVVMLFGCASSSGVSSTNTGYSEAPAKFEGTWKHPNPQAKNATYIFTGSRMLYKDDNGISRLGTFTFTDTEITFIPERANTWKGWTQGYTLQDGLLILAQDGSHMYGPFEKQ